MPITTRFQIFVRRPNGTIAVFLVDAHRTSSAAERLFGREFYEKSSEPVPEGEHHEIEVISPTTWEKAKLAEVHVHQLGQEVDRRYICWTGHLPTLSTVETFLGTWAVGAVYADHAEADFGPLFAQDPGSFLQRMEKQHGIRIESIGRVTT